MRDSLFEAFGKSNYNYKLLFVVFVFDFKSCSKSAYKNVFLTL